MTYVIIDGRGIIPDSVTKIEAWAFQQLLPAIGNYQDSGERTKLAI